jgi:hypothetical protein
MLSTARPALLRTLLLATAASLLVSGCSVAVPTSLGAPAESQAGAGASVQRGDPAAPMTGTFLADERTTASLWSAERIWLLETAQQGSDITGWLTNVGPVIDPGASPQQDTRLISARRPISGSTTSDQISLASTPDASAGNDAPIELTGVLHGDQLDLRMRRADQQAGESRQLAFRRIASSEVSVLQNEWIKSLNTKLGVQAEATLQARRNR